MIRENTPVTISLPGHPLIETATEEIQRAADVLEKKNRAGASTSFAKDSRKSAAAASRFRRPAWGNASIRNIAAAFLARDVSKLEYYEQITKGMPGKVLAKHGVVERPAALCARLAGNGAFPLP